MKEKKTLEAQQLINILIVFALIAITATQFVVINSISSIGTTTQVTGTSTNSGTNLKSIIPTGTPAYGQEIGVSFDSFSKEPDAQIAKMAAFDKKITFDSLTTEQQQRYVEIGTSISCEFCCGAEAIIFSDGRAACGCSHSAAMRGLSKYLLKNHGNKYTNAKILSELVKWKTMYFPKQMTTKLSAGTNELNSAPDMVGGC